MRLISQQQWQSERGAMDIDLAGQPFPKLIGMEVIEAAKSAVRGRVLVRTGLCTNSRRCTGAPSWHLRILWARSVPLHVGRRSSVWQTRLTREDGSLVAVATQTQLALT
jgi:hypothetical protein